MIGKMIQEMAKNNLDEFFDLLEKKHEELNLGQLKHTFLEMMSNFKYLEDILNIARDLVTQQCEIDSETVI